MSEPLHKTSETTASDRVAAFLSRMNARAAADTGVDVEIVEAAIAKRTAELTSAREPARAAIRAAMEAAQEVESPQPERQVVTESAIQAAALNRPVYTGIMI